MRKATKSAAGTCGLVLRVLALWVAAYVVRMGISMVPLSVRVRLGNEAEFWAALTHATWFTEFKSTEWLRAVSARNAVQAPTDASPLCESWGCTTPVLDASQAVPTVEDILTASHGLTHPLLVKGVGLHGKLPKFASFELAQQHLNLSKTYMFEVKEERADELPRGEEFTMGEALERMRQSQDLYLRFSFELTEDNPELDEGLIETVEAIKSSKSGRSMRKEAGVDGSLRHCFLNYGTRFHTTQHTGFIANYFVQVSGRKLWRFVDGQYTPYMKARKNAATHAFRSELPFLASVPGLEDKLPVIDIVTEPGDLLVFPGYYWHEVHNLDDDALTLGCGFRPVRDVLRSVGNTLMPSLNPAQALMALQLVPGVVSEVSRKVLSIGARQRLREKSQWVNRERDLVDREDARRAAMMDEL